MKNILSSLILGISLLLSPLASGGETSLDFLGSIGSGEGGEKAQLRAPRGVAHLGDQVFVADTQNHRVQIFTDSGKLLRAFGIKGRNAGELNSPTSLCITEATDKQPSQIFVVDSGNERISAFDRDGKYVRSFGSKILSNPKGVACGAQDRIYVADTGNSRVVIFSDDGIFLGHLGTPGKKTGELREPTSVAAFVDGSVVVADAGNETLVAFRSGEKSPGVLGRGKYGALFADSRGTLYAVDYTKSQVLVMDMAGRIIHAFGSFGDGRGQLKNPEGMWTADGEILLANTGNNRVDRFKLTLANEPPALLREKPLPRFYRGEVAPGRFVTITRNSDQLYSLDAAGGHVLRQRYKPDATAFVDQAGGRESLPFTVDPHSAGLAVLEGNFFISDSKTDRVIVRDAKGQESFSFGGSGSAPGKFNSPGPIRTYKNQVYVLDSGNARIQVFSRDGVFLQQIGNGLKKPLDLAISPEGQILVVDQSPPRIVVIDPKDLQVSAFSKFDADTIFEEPQSVDVDVNGWMYVLDEKSSGLWVHAFSPGFKPLFKFQPDILGAGGEKYTPKFVRVIAGDWLQIFLADSEHGFLTKFWVEPAPERPVKLLLNARESEIRFETSAIQDSFFKALRVYRLESPTDNKPERVAEGGLLDLSVKRPAGEPPYYFAVAQLNKSGLESQLSPIEQSYFHEGLFYFERQRDELAEEAFTESLKEKKDHGPTLKYLALTQARMGKLKEAEKTYEMLEKIPEYRSEAEIFRGQMYLQSGKYKEAEEIFLKLKQSKPDSIDVAIGLSQAFKGQGQLQRSISTLQEALRAYPNEARLHAMIGENYLDSQLYEKAKESYAKATHLSPETGVFWLGTGKAQRALKQIDESIVSFKRALSLDPFDTRSLQQLGDIYLSKRRYAELDEFLKKLPRELEGTSEVLILQGKLLAARGQVEDAIAKLEAASELPDADPKILIELGNLYDARGLSDLAIGAYRKSVEKQASNVQGWLGLGGLYLKAGSYAEAEKAFNQAIFYDENSPKGYVGLGDAHFAQGEWDDAIKNYQKAVQTPEGKLSDEILLKLGRAYARNQKSGEALAVFEQALNRNPNSAPILLELGKQYLASSFLVKADEVLKRALVLEPNNPEILATLGEVSLRHFRYDEAIRYFTEASRLKPDDPKYRDSLNQATLSKKSALETNTNAPPVEIMQVDFQNIFAAIYKYYAGHSFGEIKFRNNTEQNFEKVVITFQMKEIMDFPSSFTFKKLAAHEILTVPVKATFSNKILELSEDSTIQAKIDVAYFMNGQEKKADFLQPVKIYSRNALNWDESEMVGSFITPKDPPVSQFARSVEKLFKKEGLGVNPELATAIKLFDALGAIKLTYVVDPNSPYERVSVTKGAIDYVQFPRDTLQEKTGDCDDLVVLFAAALESLGIETQLITIPGHLLMMFKTSAPASDLMVTQDNQVWVPVEMTVVGGTFTGAWTKGAQLYRKAAAEKQVGLINVHRAWKSFEPVTLPADKKAGVLASEAEMKKTVLEDFDAQKRQKLESASEPMLTRLKTDERDTDAKMNLGLTYAKNQAYPNAVEQFQGVLAVEPQNLSARVNLGNVYLKQGLLAQAIEQYLAAENYDKMDAEIKMNLAIAYYQKKDIESSKEKFKQAERLDPSVAESNRYLKALLFK